MARKAASSLGLSWPHKRLHRPCQVKALHLRVVPGGSTSARSKYSHRPKLAKNCMIHHVVKTSRAWGIQTKFGFAGESRIPWGRNKMAHNEITNQFQACGTQFALPWGFLTPFHLSEKQHSTPPTFCDQSDYISLSIRSICNTHIHTLTKAIPPDDVKVRLLLSRNCSSVWDWAPVMHHNLVQWLWWRLIAELPEQWQSTARHLRGWWITWVVNHVQ